MSAENRLATGLEFAQREAVGLVGQIRRISIDEELSRSTRQLGDMAEVVRYGKLAVQSYLALHQHDDTTARNSSGEVAYALLDSARPLQAIDYLDGLWHLTDAARPEIESDDQIALLHAYAAAQNSSGRVEDALSTLDREMRLLARISAQRLWLTILERERTNAFIELGQLALAESALERATAAASRDQQKPEYLLLPRAKLALAKGKSEGARETLSALLNSTNLRLSLRNRLGADCLVSEAWLTDGRWNEAEEGVSKALARIESFNQREALADLESRALWVRGRALLGRNEPAAALPSLERAVSLLEGVVDTRVSLQLSHVLGSLAQAQFRTGHALEARKTFERMKTIYAQHPDIGSTVRAELASVARELSARS
jgi:tetratricopeptide (TPR) repeat protein